MCLLCARCYFKGIHILTHSIFIQLKDVGTVILQMKKLRLKRGSVSCPSQRQSYIGIWIWADWLQVQCNSDSSCLLGVVYNAHRCAQIHSCEGFGVNFIAHSLIVKGHIPPSPLHCLCPFFLFPS